jgi:hypothetical protein
MELARVCPCLWFQLEPSHHGYTGQVEVGRQSFISQLLYSIALGCIGGLIVCPSWQVGAGMAIAGGPAGVFALLVCTVSSLDGVMPWGSWQIKARG